MVAVISQLQWRDIFSGFYLPLWLSWWQAKVAYERRESPDYHIGHIIWFNIIIIITSSHIYGTSSHIYDKSSHIYHKSSCISVLCPGQSSTREPDPGQKSFRTGPGTARISESVLEPEPEPPKALSQFQNRIFFRMSAPTLRTKSILFGCALGKN